MNESVGLDRVVARIKDDAEINVEEVLLGRPVLAMFESTSGRVFYVAYLPQKEGEVVLEKLQAILGKTEPVEVPI